MYCWDELYWEWHSELFIPESQWTFVAAVVEPTQGSVYMKPLNGTFSYATNPGPHHIIADTGDFLSKLGDDLNGNNMDGTCFEGRMSDVRIYRRALSAGEIAYLAGMTYGDDPVEPYFKTLDKWRADADGSGKVDLADFAIMADCWLEEVLFPIP